MKNELKKRAAKVVSGLDVLTRRKATDLAGKRIGLLAHAASVTSELQYAWDVLASVPEVELKVLFSPEHGLTGTHQDLEGVIKGQESPLKGVRVCSLYGTSPDSLKPSKEMLEGVDVLLVDLQDVGSRYYTYVATLAYCMEACRDAGPEIWVLDRPNPISGGKVEGSSLVPEVRSFVGRYPMPVRHGMTIGECAGLINDFYGVMCRLRVVPMEGWRRSMWYDQTGLPWVMPSPNMPTLDTATVYPGTCLIEGTNLSEGRGTTRPFEIVGAPWIEPKPLARRLQEIGLPGVSFRPLWFKPAFQKHAGKTCGGVQIHVLNRDRFLPFLTGVHLVCTIAWLWPEPFAWRQETYEFESHRPAIDLLAGGAWLRDVVEGKRDLESLPSEWDEQIRSFEGIRRQHLIYT